MKWTSTLPDNASSDHFGKYLLRLKPNKEKFLANQNDPAVAFSYSGTVATTLGYLLPRYAQQRTSNPDLQWEWRPLTPEDEIFSDVEPIEPSDELTKLRLRVIELESAISEVKKRLATVH